jgi:hypothetical protein
MTTRMKSLLIGLVILALVSVGAYAQTTASHDVTMNVASITRMGLDATTTITLDLDSAAITAAGATTGSDSALDAHYLRYTVVTTGATPRHVTANISAGTVLGGTSLVINANPTGTNEGTGATITMTGVAQTLISGILSCATGVAATSGAPLDYTLNATNVTLLNAGDTSTVTILYTIL